ncbi:type II toxin-antitoxin system RelE/ParE family toxin [Streptomyces polygonati]|uniref:Type II toxin-antitoxin system RelE/ParE family toxin n=1 Tax=Streptomyces polygonati TaxID=1617087 RepID=A0ABV8HVP5_9ACTN
MTLARRAFAAHPDALTDLRNLPEPIRDQALLHLQDLVNGEKVATRRLTGRLEGFHKVILGVGSDLATHRLVVQFRPAPATSQHEREVYLVAAGPRADYAVYRAAQHRTGRTQTPPPDPATAARIRAARARSPHAEALTANSPTVSVAYSTSTPNTARKAIR